MAAVITINGKEFPAPDYGLNLVISTNVSEGRNAAGEFVGQRVGRDQYKVDALQWSFLDAETWSNILKEFNKFVVIAKIPDMVNNSYITLRMYPGNRSATPAAINKTSKLPTLYKECKVNLVDCGVIR